MVDGLTDERDTKRTPIVRLECLHCPNHGVEAASAGALHFSRSRIDDERPQAIQIPEPPRNDAGRATDVEQPGSAMPFKVRSEHQGERIGIAGLVDFDRLCVDQPTVERTDERPVRMLIEVCVGVEREPRVEKREPAARAS